MMNSSPNHLDIENMITLGVEHHSRRRTSTYKEPHNYTNRAIISFVDAVTKMNEEVLVPSRLKDIEVRENDATELMPINSDLYSFFQMLNTVKKDLFSSSLYYKTFQPTPSATNSGHNSGRVTPTKSLSRRASYSNSATSELNITNGNGNGNGNGVTNNYGRSYSGSPLLNLPYNPMERKLSSPSNSYGNNENNSPNAQDLLSPASLLPSLSLSYVGRATSLSSLIAAAGYCDLDAAELTAENRVQQITGCFMYHLSALYTIMGHFTKTANYITKRYQEQMDNLP